MPAHTPTGLPANLTLRQVDVYRAIIGFFLREQRMPTLRELGKAIGVPSTNGVMCHLTALRKKGLLTWERQGARSLRLVGITFRPQFDDTVAGMAAQKLWPGNRCHGEDREAED